MKNKIALFGLLIIVFSSCTTTKNLPESNNIDINEYGSYINIKNNTKPNVEGELISIDTNNIIVLIKDNKKCIIIPVKEVKHFTLRYAKPKHYGWTIPTFGIYPLIHGFFSIFTIPIHVIVTTAVTLSGENSFKYSDRNMTYDKLKMFARFPQGIPPNIDIARIK